MKTDVLVALSRLDERSLSRTLPTMLLLLTVLRALPGASHAAEPVPVINVTDIYRGDPRENEAALREALPALYLEFRTPSKNN